MQNVKSKTSKKQPMPFQGKGCTCTLLCFVLLCIEDAKEVVLCKIEDFKKASKTSEIKDFKEDCALKVQKKSKQNMFCIFDAQTKLIMM